MNPAAVFDRIAPGYDRLWTCAGAGLRQRELFWKHAAPFFREGSRVLDAGCGTGDDAVRLMARGVRVTAIDISPRMVEMARSRGVDARVLAVEQLAPLDGQFDCILSNFGALNCVADLSALREPLARAVRPGGYAILCLLGRFCAWETIWFLLHGAPRKALRRWRGEAATSGGMRVRYPRTREIRRALSPPFELIARFGIGIAVPPSYVRGLANPVLSLAAKLDRRISGMRGVRALADHSLLIFRRSGA